MAENLGFARKYRPTSLNGYVGNKEIKETVRRYLKKERPQSVLLTGDSGCGKTTLARLFVKEYLCEDRDDETGACGECMTCQSVDEYIGTGNSEMLPDVYEIDASDKSGKKDIDAMLSSMDYPPVAGDWKVYIVDEVHLLSEGAMGRLLKSLEEPPEGVLLIFCTTNPEKLLDTIRNRCQLKLHVTKPTTRDIVDLLQRVCLAEDKDYDLNGLRIIANRADNVVRDSLNYLHRVVTTRGDATGQSASLEFQEVSDKIIFDFYEAYLKKDYLEYINILYKIKTTFNFSQFLTTLTNFTVRGIYILNSVEVEGVSKEELESYLKLFKKFSPAELSYILSSIRKMNLGDIEANFMAFIYTEEKGVTEEVKQVRVPETSVSEERLLRNSNLQNLEKAKLEEGSKAIQDELKVVGFSDVSAEYFSLEKVDE